MRAIRTGQFNRKSAAVLAALAISALAAPLALGASHALATSEEPAAVAAGLRVGPVEAAPGIAAAGPQEAAPCLRKVRVVYGGYGTPADGCAAR